MCGLTSTVPCGRCSQSVHSCIRRVHYLLHLIAAVHQLKQQWPCSGGERDPYRTRFNRQASSVLPPVCSSHQSVKELLYFYYIAIDGHQYHLYSHSGTDCEACETWTQWGMGRRKEVKGSHQARTRGNIKMFYLSVINNVGKYQWFWYHLSKDLIKEFILSTIKIII